MAFFYGFRNPEALGIGPIVVVPYQARYEPSDLRGGRTKSYQRSHQHGLPSGPRARARRRERGTVRDRTDVAFNRGDPLGDRPDVREPLGTGQMLRGSIRDALGTGQMLPSIEEIRSGTGQMLRLNRSRLLWKRKTRALPTMFKDRK
jgi:hypothetical protein